jgi:hypothetical protein
MAGLFAALPAMAAVFNVRDLGAVGDGRTDDTGAIQAALDLAAASGGGTVLLPAGTYLVSPTGSRWLRVGSHTTVQGDGPTATVVRVRDAAGDYATVFGQASPAVLVQDVRFAGFRVDQNPARNVTADVRAGVAARAQNAIYLTTFDGVTVEGVAVDPAAGVNTLTFNGVTARGAAIRGCRIRFVKGRSLAPGGYDNSAVYIHGERFVVSGNRFENGSSPADAVSAIEIHGGPGGVVSGNQISGYLAGVLVVSEGATEPALASNDFAITGNAISGAAAGIQLWGLTGRALRNVTVAGNVISIANGSLAASSYVGIALQNEGVSGQVQGDHDGVVITGNTITMDREDRGGYAFADSAGILATPQGNVRNLVVANNVIRDAPSQGLRVESKVGSVSGFVARDNVIVDAGNNPSAGPYRVGMLFAGAFKGSQVRGNVLVDTGPALNGATGLYSSSVGAGSDLQLEGNAVSVADPYRSLSHSIGTNVYASRRVALPFRRTITPDAMQGRTFVITVPDRWPFSIAPATGGVPGQRIAIHVRNAAPAGRPMVAWLPGYRLAGPWVPPAVGFGRIVEFEWDGSSWGEISRSAGDLPN